MENARRFSLSAAFFILSLSVLGAQGAVELEALSKGASSLLGYYSPLSLSLTAGKPESLKKSPAMRSPLFGVLPVKSDGKKIFHVAIDETGGSASVIYVDSNGDGDLTNDPLPDWKAAKDAKGYSTYLGGASLELGSGKDRMDGYIGMYRFDPSDPSRSRLKNTLLYFRDYAYQGSASIGGQKYRIALSDESVSGDFSGEGAYLFIDRDGNGSFDPKWERFEARKPFAIQGATYELRGLKPLGGRFGIAVSSAVVAEIAAPPDHRKGKPITPFKAADLEGKPLKFPSDYSGKIVLLDFWATWCGPCIQELPGLVSVYSAYAPKGFDVLGVSLDSAGQEAQLRSFMKEKGMTWRQVYDGGGWKAAIAALYAVDSIPAPFLVDGDSGEILAVGEALRGQSLKATIEKALALKAGR